MAPFTMSFTRASGIPATRSTKMGVQSIRIRVFAAFVSAAAMAAPAIAQTTTPVRSAAVPLSRVHIGNFGKINDNYFRGSQPKGADYQDLAAIGVKTVIDL